MPALSLALFVGLSVVHVVSQGTGPDRLAEVTQPLLMPVLAAHLLAVAPSRDARLVRWTLLGLGLSFVGDTVPRFVGGDAAFQAMIGSFLLAQVCYLVAFRPYVGRSILRRDRVRLAPYVVALVVLLAACLPAAGVLAPAVVVYGGCLVGMAVLSTGLPRPAWLGGALFVVSDGLIALEAFDVWTQPGHDVWVMSTYCAAQLLLVVGVLRQVRAEAGEAAGHHPPVVPAG